MCTGAMLIPLPVPLTLCFFPQLFRSASWVFFLVFLYLLVHKWPDCRYIVVFSTIQFLCILLLERMFTLVQVLQQRVPDPNSFLPTQHEGTRDSEGWEGR